MANNLRMIFDGAFHSAEEAVVPVTSRGVMYGDGCFETIHSYRGQFLKFSEHLKRLKEGLNFLSIQYPRELEKSSLTTKIKALLDENNLADQQAVLRLQVWRAGSRGYTTSRKAAHYSITATPFSHSKETCRLATVDIQRIPSASLPACYKLSGGTNYIIAAQQAAQQGADDALLETIEGNVSETTIANIFWLKQGTVYTPSVDCDILPGITRQIILNILQKKLQIETKEGGFPVGKVKEADAVWLCNSLKEIQPVRGIDDAAFKTDQSFFEDLREAFSSYKSNNLKINSA